MESKWYLSGRMLVILLFLSLCCCASMSASIPNMKGTWDGISLEMYSQDSGYLSSTPYDVVVIKDQDGRAFAGEESYAENGQLNTEPIAAVFSADGTRFWQEHTGMGLSVGEMVSDKEFYNYMLFPDQGPRVLVTHMVKNGTQPSNWVDVLPNLTGSWNFTYQRSEEDDMVYGTYTITSQQGRTWTGTLEITEEDGSQMMKPVLGTIDGDGNLYAVTDTGAFHFGTLTGDDTMHFALIHPKDTDHTYHMEGWMSRNGAEIKEQDVTYPDITGNWTIANRMVVVNGTVTDIGAYEDDWMAYKNQTRQFFTALRHPDEQGIPAEREVYGMFFGTDKAFLVTDTPSFIVYDEPREEKIEAIVIRNLEDQAIFFDTLVPE